MLGPVSALGALTNTVIVGPPEAVEVNSVGAVPNGESASAGATPDRVDGITMVTISAAIPTSFRAKGCVNPPSGIRLAVRPRTKAIVSTTTPSATCTQRIHATHNRILTSNESLTDEPVKKSPMLPELGTESGHGAPKRVKTYGTPPSKTATKTSAARPLSPLAKRCIDYSSPAPRVPQHSRSLTLSSAPTRRRITRSYQGARVVLSRQGIEGFAGEEPSAVHPFVPTVIRYK